VKHAWLAGLMVPAILGSVRPADAIASAELYRTQAYFYGRFEARVQYAPGSGVISSFFLWKDGSSATTSWNELDYEKLNADCRMQTNAWTGQAVQHVQINAMPGDICAGYHTYSFEWTPTYIAWAVDGVEIRRETGAIAADYTANASAGMTIHFNVWPGNESFGGAFSSSILPVHEYISWVQYSSYVNGAFQLVWREEFDGSGVPNGWAEGNWLSPYGLSTHNPANVNYVNGIAILSLTADNATGFTGTPPPDSATGGTSGSGGAGGTGSGGLSTGGTATTGGRTGTGGGSSGGSNSVAGGGPSNGGTQTTGGSIGTGASSPAVGGGLSNGGTQATGGQLAGGASATGGSVGTGASSPVVGGGPSRGGAQASGGLLTGGNSSASGGSPPAGSTGGSQGPSTGGTRAGLGGGTAGLGSPVKTGGASSTSGPNGLSGGTQDSACSCRLPAGSRSSNGAGLLVLGLGALLASRRQRRFVRAADRVKMPAA
jgi:endo-1,3-1,4-beta-glycanase ExoK